MVKANTAERQNTAVFLSSLSCLDVALWCSYQLNANIAHNRYLTAGSSGLSWWLLWTAVTHLFTLKKGRICRPNASESVEMTMKVERRWM